jgi:ATP-dependent DNA helicase RecG
MAEEYILKNIHIGMKLAGLYREDVPEISQAAFREAVINAFCHRDYNEYDSVNIAVFKDRVEIRNPGGLFGGLTIEQIKKEPIPKRRAAPAAQEGPGSFQSDPHNEKDCFFCTLFRGNSKRRNELIAEMFHRVHLVEKWGRGIDLILSSEPTANFKEVADIFITTFERKNYDATQD